MDNEEDVGREQDELQKAQKQEEVLIRRDRDRKQAILRAMLREVLRKGFLHLGMFLVKFHPLREYLRNSVTADHDCKVSDFVLTFRITLHLRTLQAGITVHCT